jgi:signal transduction histidine kinase
VSTTLGIRHRLLTILLLGVLTSALSLTALVHLLSTTTAQRIERAREGITEEADRLARNPAQLVEPSAAGVVGMRAGVWDGGDAPPALPPGWLVPLRSAISTCTKEHARVVEESPVPEGRLVIAVEPAVTGAYAWAGFMVRPLPSIRTWQWIVGLLALATVLLVATTVYAIVTVTRGAAALRASLKALATDLDAPIPRPEVRELSDVADGIARLAENLARARKEEERLGRELARQERLAALGRVAAGVAHEVRNPLASIKLRLDLAAAGAKLPEIADRAISHASSEIARLDRLVADLLVVAGRASGPKTTTSLGALLRARVEALAPWSAEHNVTIAASGDAEATLDADAIARAIDNLLRNAVEASPSGSRVDVKLVRRGDLLAIRVEDRGSGVPPERVVMLFEPFFTTKPEGTGLGLALCRAIARAHGGDVTYAREGATTSFELALASRAQATPPATAKTSEAAA